MQTHEEIKKYMREYSKRNRERYREYNRVWAKKKRAENIAKGLRFDGEEKIVFPPKKIVKKRLKKKPPKKVFVPKPVIPTGRCQSCTIYLDGKFANSIDEVYCERCKGEI